MLTPNQSAAKIQLIALSRNIGTVSHFDNHTPNGTSALVAPRALVLPASTATGLTKLTGSASPSNVHLSL